MTSCSKSTPTKIGMLSDHKKCSYWTMHYHDGQDPLLSHICVIAAKLKFTKAQYQNFYGIFEYFIYILTILGKQNFILLFV